MSKYGVFSGPYFPVFCRNAGKCGPEKTPHLDTFHAVIVTGRQPAALFKKDPDTNVFLWILRKHLFNRLPSLILLVFSKMWILSYEFFQNIFYVKRNNHSVAKSCTSTQELQKKPCGRAYENNNFKSFLKIPTKTPDIYSF